jgi:sortase A
VLSRILGGVGRTLITAGTLILLFVAYQLWGTGLQEAQSQKELGSEFEELRAAVDVTTTTAAPTTTTTTNPLDPPTTALTPVTAPTVDLPLPAEGDPVAQIRIPSIGVDRTVVSGISLDQLKRGPGHYPETPMPGQAGNVAIAGHRTTYGQPFHNIDKVQVGDEIIVETVQGEFIYEATETIIVRPSQVEILEDQGDNRITLIACHPKYSAAQRIILIGELKGEAVPQITGQSEVQEAAAKIDQVSIDEGASAPTASKRPAVLWGLAAAGVWFVTWLAQVLLRRRARMRATAEATAPTRGQRLLTWSPYLVGLPVFLVVLYVFFENFGRLLPGNY